MYKVFCEPCLCSVYLFTNVNISYFFSHVMVGNHNSKTKSYHNCCHWSWTLKHLKSNFYLLVSICCSQALRMHRGNISGICSSFQHPVELRVQLEPSEFCQPKADFEMEGMVKIQADESRGCKGAPCTRLRMSLTACATQSSQSVLYQTIIAHFKIGMY